MTPRPASLSRILLPAMLGAALLSIAAGLGFRSGILSSVRAAEPTPGRPAVALLPDPAPAPTVVWHGPRTARVVALTFDDGWNAATLRRVYRILVRERVPATFFVTGIYVQRAPDLWRQIAGAGFELANHSYLHRDTRRMTPHQVDTDLARTRDVVERATGVRMLPVYRPPYGARTPVTDRVVASAGYPTIVMWDVAAADTGRRPSVAGVVRSATTGRPGSIVLLHAGPRITPRALPAIIERYRARGFRFVTLSELLGLPAAGGAVGAGLRLDRHPPGRGRAMDAQRDVPLQGPGTPTGGPSADQGGPAEAHPVREPAPPAAPADTARAAPAPAAPPAARDGAWARRDGIPGTVAVFSVILLVLLVVLGAAAGRGRPEDDPGHSANA